MSSPKFIDQALAGDALLFEIDDFVSRWHEDHSDVSLSDFLGMTPQEYDLWLSEPDLLAHIVRARRDHISLESLVQRAVNDNQLLDAQRIAARTDSTVNIDRLRRWLEREGIDIS